MGLIKAAIQTVTGGIADQFLETIEPYDMSDNTVFTRGVAVRKGVRGTDNTVSNGSVVHVYPNQMMLMVDGGKIVDYCAEEGYYTVENSSLPSAFHGTLGAAIDETFARFKYGGVTPKTQKVYYVNLQEIKGIRFGTPAPLNYFDQAYNAELFLRIHGTYTIKITNPLLFYAEAVPKNAEHLTIDDINEQYLNEFLEALAATINKMSADGVRISFLSSKGTEVSRYLADVLDAGWREMRGFELQTVAIASISYDAESQKLINMRNQGAMMSDPTVREGYVQSAVARGIENAGSNAAGAGTGFMGVNMAMGAAGGVGGFSATNAAAAEKKGAGWTCPTCGTACPDDAGFCGKCGTKRPGTWVCPDCGRTNDGAFCGGCGKKKPEAATCPNCGKAVTENDKFCPGCGHKLG